MLGVVKHRVNSARVPFVRRHGGPTTPTVSARWAARVVARPVRYGGAAAARAGRPGDPGVLDAPRLRRRRQRRPRPRPPARPTTWWPTATAPAPTGRSQVVVDADGGKLPASDPRHASSTRSGQRSRGWPRSTHRSPTEQATWRSSASIPDHLPAGRAHQRPARSTCATDESPRPRGSDVTRRPSPARTALTVRRVVAAAAADAVVPRGGDRAVVPGADGRVPLGAGPAEGRCPQRTRRRGGVRRRRRRLPVGLGAGA